jgi:SAM-dependent methyltransferase
MMDDLSTHRPDLDGTGERTYSETVARGHYGKSVPGLRGKYDNVRTYWEDRVTRTTVRPAIQDCVRAARVAGRGVRVLDMGCGAGQGFELLTHIDETGPSLGDEPRFVLPKSEEGLYLGIDYSEAMIEHGRRNYTERHK